MISPAAIFRERDKLRSWEKIWDVAGGRVLVRGRVVYVVEYEIAGASGALDGKRLCFFSDLHWDGNTGVGDDLVNLCGESRADWVICGGDIISYSCHLESALELMGRLSGREGKLAVAGNWDRKRWYWYTRRRWTEGLSRAGYVFLCNEELLAGGFRFWGADDFKLGSPEYRPCSGSGYPVLLAHNPDTVIELDAHMAEIRLVLCGHTHGGQVRIPGFGAFRTSSKYWRKFDRGLFRNRRYGTYMLISAGLGCTGPDLRFCCRREVSLIRLKYEGGIDKVALQN